MLDGGSRFNMSCAHFLGLATPGSGINNGTVQNLNASSGGAPEKQDPDRFSTSPRLGQFWKDIIDWWWCAWSFIWYTNQKKTLQALVNEWKVCISRQASCSLPLTLIEISINTLALSMEVTAPYHFFYAWSLYRVVWTDINIPALVDIGYIIYNNKNSGQGPWIPEAGSSTKPKSPSCPSACIPSPLPLWFIHSFMPSAARGGGEREVNEEHAKSDESTPTLCPGFQMHCARCTARAQYRTKYPPIHPFIHPLRQQIQQDVHQAGRISTLLVLVPVCVKQPD